MSAVAYVNLTVLGEIQCPGSLKREAGGWDEQGQVPESTEPDSNREGLCFPASRQISLNS